MDRTALKLGIAAGLASGLATLGTSLVVTGWWQVSLGRGAVLGAAVGFFLWGVTRSRVRHA